MIKCAIHPDIEAIGACCNCGRFVCPECKVNLQDKIYCTSCVTERLDKGYWPGKNSAVYNSSGAGAGSFVPPEVKGWNWGGFLLTWIWGIGNNVWIALISLLGFIPWIGWLINLTMRIILGIKGSEWAWQNKKWDSIDHFKRTQRTWMWWGVGVIVLEVLLAVSIVVLIISLIAIASTVGGYPDWWRKMPWW